VRLRLIVPVDVEEPTGGNVYDRAVAEALRRDGDEVEMVPCEPSMLSAAVERPWSGPTLVDGLLACSVRRRPASSSFSVLVHMPLSLQTGLPPDRVTELDALEKQALLAAPVVVTTSHWTARHLAGKHGLRDIAVATPGVDPAEVVAGSDPPLLVHLAALVPHKNQLGVVAALAGLRDLPWRARLAGATDRDPAYATAVRDAVVAADLADRIDMSGVLTRSAAWAGADLALLPSLVEAYGLAVSEALARGIPAVVSDGGPAEALGHVDGGKQPGVVVPAGDPVLLRRALRRWLTDDAYRAELRALALSRRSDLDGWSTTAHRIRQALTVARLGQSR
jgi:glycosyltransferase involved in cell wall biosynthesis